MKTLNVFIYRCIALFFIAQFSFGVKAQRAFSVEFNYGMGESFSSNLTVKQNGEPDIFFFADYASLSLALPPYWMWRLGYWTGNNGWEFETIHHKLYVVNTPPEIDYFSISHGYNFLFLNRALKQKNGFIWRIGAGAALAHPENKVRGKELSFEQGILDIGYYWTGPCLNTSYGKCFALGRNFFLNTEAKLTYGYAYVPVVDGNAMLHNLAVHFNIGLGFRAEQKKKD